MADKLRLRARGTACVPDPHGTERSPQIRRMIGRRHEQVTPGQWAWIPTREVEEIPYHHDIAKAVRDGDLEAVDDATATACGMAFKPSAPTEPEET